MVLKRAISALLRRRRGTTCSDQVEAVNGTSSCEDFECSLRRCIPSDFGIICAAVKTLLSYVCVCTAVAIAVP